MVLMDDATLPPRDRSARKQFPEILALGDEVGAITTDHINPIQAFSFQFEDSEMLNGLVGLEEGLDVRKSTFPDWG